MIEGLFRKGLILSIILLLISMNTFASTADIISLNSISSIVYDGKTLYVGGTGEGNYTKIQDAIDNASSGDTVFVYSGTYYEHVVIKKSIYLIGENRDTTIIDGRQYFESIVIRIVEDWVSICNFTLQNSSRRVDGNAGINIMANFCNIIDNNICLNGAAGIDLGYDSSGNIIKNNNIFSNGHGIYSNSLGENNVIENNEIISNHWGIEFRYYCSNTIILFNNISNNYDGIMFAGDGNIIISNNIQGNYDEYGLAVVGDNNRIEKNNFIKNEQHAAMGIFSEENVWDENYWDDWIGIRYNLPIFQIFPKIILKYWGLIFWILIIDWNPAKEPYDIPPPPT
jgi:parallel beta-helix repeat protein